MPIIEGAALAVLRVAGVPSAGTTEVQNLAIGGTPTGGTFKLGFGGFVTPAITWSATNATLLANINAALQGSAEVQTITFAGSLSGTFRLRYRGQTTAPITWSSTNNTLRDNVDAELEALANIGSSGVATAVGSMMSGVGTLTVTFADYGPQLPISVIDNRTGGTITVATTTPGVGMNSVGKSGIVASDVDLSSGIGNLALTFSGANLANKAQPMITVEDNSLTGTAPTLTITETTPGVDADGRSAPTGALAVNTTNGKLYINTSTTAQAPTWTVVGGQS